MCGDSCGGVKTFAEQVPMPIGRHVEYIDGCISHIVAALNAGGIRTVASCCGHGGLIGNIVLEDGREIGIFKGRDEWKKANSAVYCAASPRARATGVQVGGL